MIEILDLGVSNVSSVVSALSDVSKNRVKAVSEAGDSRKPELLVIPGNGTFDSGMRQLKLRGFDRLILEHYHQRQKKVLGLCLGMQLMGNTSSESIGTTGLGLVSASTSHLQELNQNAETVPRIGWHEVFWEDASVENHFSIEKPGEHVFFAHSYYLELFEENATRLLTKFGDETYLAGFVSGDLCGLQFHPEKSSFSGLKILSEIISWAGIEK